MNIEAKAPPKKHLFEHVKKLTLTAESPIEEALLSIIHERVSGAGWPTEIIEELSLRTKEAK